MHNQQDEQGLTAEQSQGLSTLSEIGQRIIGSWLAVLPPGGWDRCELFWAQAGPHTFCQMELHAGGQISPVEFPAALHPLLKELQAAMTSPEYGGWLSTLMTAKPSRTRPGGAEVTFSHNWDERYYINGLPGVFDLPRHEAPVPTDEMFREELAARPRAAQFWPHWLAAPGSVVPDFRQPVAPPPALGWVTAPGTFGWASVYGQIDECLQGQLRHSPRMSPVLLGLHGEEARRAALGQLLDLVQECTLRTLRRSSGEVTVKLWREWSRHTGLGQPQDLSGLDTSAPLADLPQTGALGEVLKDVTRVIRVLAARMIAERFKAVAPS